MVPVLDTILALYRHVVCKGPISQMVDERMIKSHESCVCPNSDSKEQLLYLDYEFTKCL